MWDQITKTLDFVLLFEILNKQFSRLQLNTVTLWLSISPLLWLDCTAGHITKGLYALLHSHSKTRFHICTWFILKRSATFRILRPVVFSAFSFIFYDKTKTPLQDNCIVANSTFCRRRFFDTVSISSTESKSFFFSQETFVTSDLMKCNFRKEFAYFLNCKQSKVYVMQRSRKPP